MHTVTGGSGSAAVGKPLHVAQNKEKKRPCSGLGVSVCVACSGGGGGWGGGQHSVVTHSPFLSIVNKRGTDLALQSRGGSPIHRDIWYVEAICNADHHLGKTDRERAQNTSRGHWWWCEWECVCWWRWLRTNLLYVSKNATKISMYQKNLNGPVANIFYFKKSKTFEVFSILCSKGCCSFRISDSFDNTWCVISPRPVDPFWNWINFFLGISKRLQTACTFSLESLQLFGR